MPRVEKRTTQKSGIFCFWERVFKIDGLSVPLHDNSENNHFYIQQIKLCSYKMANLWNGPALKKAEAVKKKAWTNFLNRLSKAEKSRFVSQGSVDKKNNVTAEVFFKQSKGSFQSVFGSDKILECGNEKAWFGRRWGFSVPIGATWFKSFFGHPCSTF